MIEIYKIETLGCLDGPGVRTVIFMQGCPMRCCYCHNADSWRLGMGYGEPMSEVELLNLALRYKAYYGDKGGVTLSGGEPLMQAKKPLGLVKLLKEHGIHVTLDTSGCIVNEDTRKLIKAVDLVILDVKANDDQQYRMLTNHSMEKPLETLHYIQLINKPYWIRQVILPGINESGHYLDDLDRLTDHPMRERLERLNYHTFGLEKWEEWQIDWRIGSEVRDKR